MELLRFGGSWGQVVTGGTHCITTVPRVFCSQGNHVCSWEGGPDGWERRQDDTTLCLPLDLTPVGTIFTMERLKAATLTTSMTLLQQRGWDESAASLMQVATAQPLLFFVTVVLVGSLVLLEYPTAILVSTFRDLQSKTKQESSSTTIFTTIYMDELDKLGGSDDNPGDAEMPSSAPNSSASPLANMKRDATPGETTHPNSRAEKESAESKEKGKDETKDVSKCGKEVSKGTGKHKDASRKTAHKVGDEQELDALDPLEHSLYSSRQKDVKLNIYLTQVCCIPLHLATST